MRRSTASLSIAPAPGCRYRQLVTGVAAAAAVAVASTTLPLLSPSPPYPAGGEVVLDDTMEDDIDMAAVEGKARQPDPPLTLIDRSLETLECGRVS
jgi:hypothetical protein